MVKGEVNFKKIEMKNEHREAYIYIYIKEFMQHNG
jgi:hypothetical protein